ncbi:MAG TPA: MarR family transcriptional regulator [Propionicimonas sp.]|nr:MarR family transcriptional regulator [Propionicimonas sp.]
MHQLPDLALGDERDALVAELGRLQAVMHDKAVALVGPMPLPPDLTMQQVRVLGCVVKEPGLSGHELGERLGVSAPTASGLVDRLVDKHLIMRVDDPGDRRVRRLHPTADGLSVVREMDSLFGRAMGAVIAHLSLADLELMAASTRAMLDALDRAANEAG